MSSVDDNHKHVNHLTSVVETASGKIVMRKLLMLLFTDWVAVGQALLFPVGTTIDAYINMPLLSGNSLHINVVTGSKAAITFTHVAIMRFFHPTGATCLTDFCEIWRRLCRM